MLYKLAKIHLSLKINPARVAEVTNRDWDIQDIVGILGYKVQEITDHKELTRLLESGRGYVLNDRPDRKLLHHVSCQSLEAMVPREYRKLFFEEADEAEKWLNQEFGPDNWTDCSSCGGKHHQNPK